MTDRPKISVVVPVYNEADGIRQLLEEIHSALEGKLPYELIVVDDGSTDQTLSILKTVKSELPELRVIQHLSNQGQSAGVITGVMQAKAPLIATLDGDGQNDPADIMRLHSVYLGQAEQQCVLIAGHRLKRKDTSIKRWSSKFANWIRRKLLHDNTPDTGCGLKLFPRECFIALPKFNHMHRYLPALFLRHGGVVKNITVNHRHRQAGTSKYGTFDRAWVGIFDLIGVRWLIKRSVVASCKEI